MFHRSISKELKNTYDNGIFLILKSHLEMAREKHPNFGGMTCVLREVADLIKADERNDSEEVKREALHVAVTALRMYEMELEKEEK